jgi:imidazole glycerol-phosphate synthase subunit HisF
MTKFKRIISRLDIKEENLVKGIQLEGLRVLGDPTLFSKKYYEGSIDELIYQDCIASLYGNNNLHDFISKVSKQIFIPLTVGGGIRSIEDIKKVLSSGADKVAVNTAAIKDVNFLKDASEIFGSSTLSISIEAVKLEDNEYYCFTESGRNNSGLKVIDWCKRIQEYGAGEIILTMVNKEGTGEGFDLEFLKSVLKVSTIPVIAHGGCGKKDDVLDLFNETDVDGISISSMFHYFYYKHLNIFQKKDTRNFNNYSNFFEGDSIDNLKKYLIKNKIEIRS